MIINGHQGLHRGLLHEAIHDGGDTQLAHASVRFRDFLSPNGQRLVYAVKQRLLAGLPRACDEFPELAAGHAVNSGCSVVCLDPFQGATHVLPLTDRFHELRFSARTLHEGFRYVFIPGGIPA
jgi:hypothetical protein